MQNLILSLLLNVFKKDFQQKKNFPNFAAFDLVMIQIRTVSTIFYCSAAITCICFPHVETVVFPDKEFINR